MASKQTPNYGLNQWNLSDSVIMADFNADNLKTEQALLSLKEDFKASDQEVERTLLAAKEELKADDQKIQQALLATKEELKADNQEIEQALLALKTNLPRFLAGTYKGSGKYGADIPCFLNLGFSPQLVIVAPEPTNSPLASGEKTSPLVAMRGAASATVSYYSGQYGVSYGCARVHLIWGDNKVSWYSSQDVTQYNVSGLTYRFLAIG